MRFSFFSSIVMMVVRQQVPAWRTLQWAWVDFSDILLSSMAAIMLMREHLSGEGDRISRPIGAASAAVGVMALTLG